MLRIEKYSEKYFNQWNKFVSESNNGTIFHHLNFLSYHQDRFKKEEHHLMWLKGESIYALMPLGIFEQNGKKVAKSPYGASFGGIVYQGKISLKESVEVVSLLVQFIKENAIDEFYVAFPPGCYYQQYSSHLEFALCSQGFKLTSADVFSVVELVKTKEDILNLYTSSCRNKVKNSMEAFDYYPNASVEEFYPILLQDKGRLNARPTHSLPDLIYLKNKFKKNLYVDIAVSKENGSKCGICYFIPNEKTILAFYMSQENDAVRLNGVNRLIYEGMKTSVEKRFSFYDFGSSTIGYVIQNIGVSNFKESFGAIGLNRQTYSYLNG